MKRVRFVISGDVQGIYYRAFIRDKALELGLNGFVHNLPNKKVEVIVEGHEAKIQRLYELCKQGPRGAIISEIKTTPLPFNGEFKTFRVTY